MSELKNILFIGDVVGLPGLDTVKRYLPVFIEKYKPDLIIANGENACFGRGLTAKEATQLFEMGINVITSGNHVWENWKAKQLLSQNPNVLRPLNYPSGNTGKGFTFFKSADGTNFAVLNLQGRTYMQTIDCPFRSADFALNLIVGITKNIIVDFHADATAEKQSIAWYLNGRVSAVIGTHTHVPTADASILSEGTAYITDVGMTGPFDSVVGMRKDIAISRFLLQTPYKYEIACEDLRMCGVFLQIDSLTGKTVKIESFMYPEARRSL